MNHLQQLQEKVKFYESSNDYRAGMDSFVEYIEYVRKLDQPVTLITLYIRFAKFCLFHNDILFARDLYKEAKVLIQAYEKTQIYGDIFPSEENFTSLEKEPPLFQNLVKFP